MCGFLLCLSSAHFLAPVSLEHRLFAFLCLFSHSPEFPFPANPQEVRTLDYTPAINRRPVDLSTPLRVRRMGRKIKILMCITMYNVRVLSFVVLPQ